MLLITGVTSDIGSAICKLIASPDTIIIGHYHTSDSRAHALENEIKIIGGTIDLVKGDLSSPLEVDDLVDYVTNKYGYLDGLVNNAALNITEGNGTIEEMTFDTFDKVAKINFYAPFMLCKAAAKLMKARGEGSIVNISSEAGRFGGRNMSHYAATKAALNTLTIAFAREVASAGIRVNAVSPGVIETDTQLQRIHSDKDRERLVSTIPMGRMGKPEEVASVVKWLLSNDSSYVSGSIISVTGAR